MKEVLILFGKSDWKNPHPFINEEYRSSYEYFYTLCRQSNIRMYRASYQWYDHEKRVFEHAWTYEGKCGGWKMVSGIRPDLIYDKTKSGSEAQQAKEHISEDYSFINDLNFTKIIDNKFVTSLIFPKWSKKNWFVKTKADIRKLLPELQSNKIVIKPISESGGKGIHIIDKKDLADLVFCGENIVQEFIDSSGGVPGISGKAHDLRLVFAGDKLIYAYIREPKDGSLLANVLQGGALTIVPIEQIPASLDPIVSAVNETFRSFSNRIFSIDVMFDECSNPWIVELNSMPGLFFTTEEKPYMAKLYRELVKMFKRQFTRGVCMQDILPAPSAWLPDKAQIESRTIKVGGAPDQRNAGVPVYVNILPK
ncbi:MAG: hypothetical protein PHT88_02790 [Candidatus Moranbacteria bacterium]|nr:hypothetical protein [Candidatus Moranbacteria bacterium]